MIFSRIDLVIDLVIFHDSFDRVLAVIDRNGSCPVIALSAAFSRFGRRESQAGSNEGAAFLCRIDNRRGTGDLRVADAGYCCRVRPIHRNGSGKTHIFIVPVLLRYSLLPGDRRSAAPGANKTIVFRRHIELRGVPVQLDMGTVNQ